MSTIQHRPAESRLWWLVAAAAVAAAVLALMIATLHAAPAPSATDSPRSTTTVSHHQDPWSKRVHACYAGRPGATMDLIRASCSNG